MPRAPSRRWQLIWRIWSEPAYPWGNGLKSVLAARRPACPYRSHALCGQGRHPPSRTPQGHAVKGGEVRVKIDRDPMPADPAADAHTDGRDFVYPVM